jgi:uncharacterized membrane protein YfcA
VSWPAGEAGALAAIACSGAVQGATGFGFVMLAVPVLLLVYPARTAVCLAVLCAAPVMAATLSGCWRDVDRRAAGPVLLGSLAGYPIGLLGLTHADARSLKLAVGALLVATALALWLREARGPAAPPPAGPRYDRPGVLVGVVSGALTTFTGMGGPPLVFYLAHRGLARDALRATVMFLNVATLGASGLVLAAAGNVVAGLPWGVLSAGVALGLAGAALGVRAFRRASGPGFRRVVLCAVLVLSALDVLGALVRS